MEFFQTYAKEIIALVVPFITWILNVRLKGRAKLIWSSPHGFNFIVHEPLRDHEGKVLRERQMVRTASIRVSNDGRETATKVEIVFNWKPQHINLWPVRHYTEYVEPAERYVMVFDSLAPQEQISIEVLSINMDLPAVIVVRSDQCVADQVTMMSVRAYPRWAERLAQVLALAGVGTLVYLFFVLLQFVVLKTPNRF